ncbi:MAG: ABC transporter ATP-binding protein [Sulfurovum sp.]|nr:ABC transporter ATP-binding protein [Sulfurovum sp.]
MVEIDIRKKLHGAQGDMHLDVQLQIQKGEFVALMGESGAGKTTLLRVLAGLENAQGDIVVEGSSWKHTPIQKREIGFVFQDYALFENMTVLENLLFVRKDIALAKELLEMTGLSTLQSQNVTGLSGGQKQRISLCRAMMKRPTLLLMDEPLSALDTKMKTHLQNEIKALHQRFNMTTIMVSHDRSGVYQLCSRVVILEKGKIVQDYAIEKMLDKTKQKHLVEVLALHKDSAKTYATVSLLGVYLNVEVSPDTQVSQSIYITLKAERT